MCKDISEHIQFVNTFVQKGLMPKKNGIML